MATNDVEFFASASPTSDVSKHARRLNGLPTDPAGLGEVVRGLLMHNINAEIAGISISPDRNGMRTFGASQVLDRVTQLDSRGLREPRPEPERLVGYCYHFALLHCAFLRAQGRPARTRCGFASYLVDGNWTDHWVVEFWDGEQWRLTDPQIGIDSLSDEHFRTGVEAWQRCRTGEAEPFDHGIGDLRGWDELRGSLVNDVGGLNKVEIGDWDWCTELKVDPLDQPSSALDDHLDTVALAAAPGMPQAALRARYEKDGMIRPPTAVIEAASPGDAAHT